MSPIIMRIVADYCRTHLHDKQKRIVKKALYAGRRLIKIIHHTINSATGILWYFLINPIKKEKYKRMKNLRLHVGCGSNKLKGFINTDIRRTSAVDLTLDLNEFDVFQENVTLLFSKAFFEHLYRPRRITHLKGAYRALGKDGVICYIGIPNFKVIAKAYLDKSPGTYGPVFDLYNVYRYSHGDPDRVPDRYILQLHKSLFDEDELAMLLTESGFDSYIIFQYAFPTDTNPVPVDLGFYASKTPKDSEELKQECIAFLQGHQDMLIIDTLEFVKQSR